MYIHSKPCFGHGRGFLHWKIRRKAGCLEYFLPDVFVLWVIKNLQKSSFGHICSHKIPVLGIYTVPISPVIYTTPNIQVLGHIQALNLVYINSIWRNFLLGSYGFSKIPFLDFIQPTQILFWVLLPAILWKRILISRLDIFWGVDCIGRSATRSLTWDYIQLFPREKPVLG